MEQDYIVSTILSLIDCNILALCLHLYIREKLFAKIHQFAQE